MNFLNLNQVLLANFKRYADQPALIFKKNGRFQRQTYDELGRIAINV